MSNQVSRSNLLQAYCSAALVNSRSFAMDMNEEQRVCVKFCFKLGKSFKEAFQMLQQNFVDAVMSHSRYHEWFK